MRVNGKNWRASKTAFRTNKASSNPKSYKARAEGEKQLAETKALEKEMKDAKKSERDQRIQAIRNKRQAKAERERFEIMETKMHKRKVERLKKKAKRNKLLNS